jgi:hypothetical protein
MSHPDWYSSWRHDAVHQLQAKNDRLNETFRLDRWPRFDYDLDNGTLTFSEDGVARVIAEIEIAGTTSSAAGNWLWAWANSSWAPERVILAEQALRFGEAHDICELRHDCIDAEGDLNDLGWALTAALVRIGNALGAYRPPRAEGGGLYLVYRTMSWAS